MLPIQRILILTGLANAPCTRDVLVYRHFCVIRIPLGETTPEYRVYFEPRLGAA